MRTLTIFFFLLTICATAQVPGTLSYQGLLTNADGSPFTGTTATVTFRFYTTEVGGTQLATRGPLVINTFRGMFTKVLGDGTADNAALPASFGNQEIYIGITISPSVTELTPRVRMTAVPYAFVAQSANSVAGPNITGTIAGSQVGTGIEAANITTGTIAAARLGIGTNVQAFDDDLTDLADGSLTGSKVGSGISAANITGALAVANGGTGAATDTDARINLGLAIGTNVQAFDADLTDLADGSLTGSKVGSGISAANITGALAVANGGTGAATAADARTNLGLVIGTNVQAFDADLTDLADGTLSSAAISLTGTDASKLATGTTAQRPGSPLEGQIRYNSTEKVMEYYNGTNWYFVTPKIAFVKDVKSPGNVQAPVTGNWTARDLNTVIGDGVLSSAPANNFSLGSGEYIIEAIVPSYFANFSRIRLYDISNNTDNIGGLGQYGNTYGNSEFSGNISGGGQVMSTLYSKITITSLTTFGIQQYLQTGYFGNATLLPIPPNDIYTQVKITKLR
jgi:hypothetical protein